jgi:hypothetical protein
MRQERKKTEACERQTISDQASPAKRLEKLDQRLGEGQGAARERARLSALLEKENE